MLTTNTANTNSYGLIIICIYEKSKQMTDGQVALNVNNHVVKNLYLLDRIGTVMKSKQCIEMAKATNGRAESQDM